MFVPLIAILEGLFGLGIGMALGAADAYYQDLEYLVTFILQLMFYGSPIVYQLSQFGSENIIVKLIGLNPITIFITSYRDCFLYHQMPDLTALGYAGLFALAVVVIGYFVFKKLERGFAEQL